MTVCKTNNAPLLTIRMNMKSEEVGEGYRVEVFIRDSLKIETANCVFVNSMIL